MGEWVRERAREREREINRLDRRYGGLGRCVRLKKIADMESISPYNLFDSLPKPFLKFYSALRQVALFYTIYFLFNVVVILQVLRNVLQHYKETVRLHRPAKQYIDK